MTYLADTFPEGLQILNKNIRQIRSEKKVIQERFDNISQLFFFRMQNKQIEEYDYYWFRFKTELARNQKKIDDLERIEKKLLRIVSEYKPQKESTGRVTEEDIQRAKEVPIEELMEVIKPRMSNNRISCPCPFHEEKTPSFCIYTAENKYHCFGCQEHGDAISMTMKLKNMQFLDAVRYLNNIR